MSRTAWSRANGTSEKQFFYWQRILRRKAFESSRNQEIPATVQLQAQPVAQKRVTFTEIRLPSSPQNTVPVFRLDLAIRKGDQILELSNSVSQEMLSRVGGILHIE